MSQRVERVLRTGGLAIEPIAEQLGLHPRTLQGRRREHGTTFSTVVDGVRREVAEQLLRDTTLPLGQIASAVGYTEHSALTRVCRRLFGVPPRTRAAAARRGPRLTRPAG